jgi:hypothetical protein
MRRSNPSTRGSRFPYEVEKLVVTALSKRERWGGQLSFRTIEEAEDYAWARLSREGGRWRVRHGRRVVASGSGYRPGEVPWSHDRTALWSRISAKVTRRRVRIAGSRRS